MNARSLLALFAAALVTGPAIAGLKPEDNARRLAQIDRNHDGVLQVDEIDLGLLNVEKKGAIDFTLPLHAEDMPQVIAAMEPPDQAQFHDRQHLFRRKHGSKAAYAFSEVDAQDDFMLSAVKKASDQNPAILPDPRLYVRRSLDKLPPGLTLTDTVGSDNQKSADKLAAGGMLVSYGRANSRASEVMVEGLLTYEIPTFDPGPLTYGRWLVSLGFSRINYQGPDKPKTASPQFKDEANLAQPGVSWEKQFNWPNGGPFTGAQLRVNGLFTTDWSFKSKIPTLEAEWSPLSGALGWNEFNFQHKDLWWRWNVTAHVDVGRVLATGPWSKAKKGDSFGHAGPKLALKLLPFPNSKAMQKTPLLFDASFAQYEKLNHDSKLIRNFTAQASWYLKKPGTGTFDPGLAFTLSYTNLKNVENKPNDDTILAGLAVGY